MELVLPVEGFKIEGFKIEDFKIEAFRAEVYSFYEKFGRMFPWRENPTPWGVMVSEFMLQQTQTERVAPYYERWMRRWDSPAALAADPLSDALAEWVGLGYNRRCRFLKECARVIAEDYGGSVPSDAAILQSLPGIGAYTAGAIACFAYNKPAVFIETNIRSAAIHYFFPHPPNGETPAKIPDRALLPALEAALDRRNPRVWHWALMDYGAALKKSQPNPSRRSAHYAKQSAFEGSLRQIRGRVIKALAEKGALSATDLLVDASCKESELYRALDSLQKDSLVRESGGSYSIS
jgi:A/G-specific adenine glycosylase